MNSDFFLEDAVVSLVIPCFNHGNTLARAVESGLRQGDECLEIIVVDDCSSDNSPSVAMKLTNDNKKLQFESTLVNSGPGRARNVGVKKARGKYISFLDADDELTDAGFFSDALKLFSIDAEMKVVKSEMEFFDPVKGYVLPTYDPRYNAAVLSSACGMLIERECFLKMGGFPEGEEFCKEPGGEDIAFMHALIQYLQPIGRLAFPHYRVWSRSRSHLDRFLANTKLKNGNKEFMAVSSNQIMTSEFEEALAKYLSDMRNEFKILP
jgi:glycosyltransferase involved in cell wall biosynthesis